MARFCVPGQQPPEGASATVVADASLSWFSVRMVLLHLLFRFPVFYVTLFMTVCFVLCAGCACCGLWPCHACGVLGLCPLSCACARLTRMRQCGFVPVRVCFGNRVCFVSFVSSLGWVHTFLCLCSPIKGYSYNLFLSSVRVPYIVAERNSFTKRTEQ